VNVEGRPDQPQEEHPYAKGPTKFNARIGYFEDWEVYAEQYKQAGDALCEWVEQNCGRALDIVIPQYYLYHHCLEIMLKDIAYSCEYLSSKQKAGEGWKKNHNLMTIWEACDKYLPKYYRKVGWNVIRKEIEVFTNISPTRLTHEALRYPTTNKENEQTLPYVVDINVLTLRDRVNAMWRTLDEIRSRLTFDVWAASGQLDDELPNFIEEKSRPLELDDIEFRIPRWPGKKRSKDKKRDQ
jgi:hypothetical protein